MKNILSLTLWVLFPVLLTAQDAKRVEREHVLAYLPETVKQFSVIRPSTILGDRDVAELRAIAPKVFDKYADKLLNQYLKFGLADLEDIDALIDATWTTESELDGQKSWSFHSVLILRTVHPNQDKFDLATHAVISETEFKGKSILKMKKALDGRYRFACILDKQTIAWSFGRASLEQVVTAGKVGPAKADFFEVWKQLKDKDVTFLLKFEERDLQRAPRPIKDLKGIRWVVGGLEPGRKVEAELYAKFDNNASATLVKDNAEKYLGFVRRQFDAQLKRNPQQAAGIKIVQELLDSAKVGQAKDVLKVTMQTKIDLKSLVEPMEQAYAASKRTEAANNLRQNSLALFNFESAHGGFPPAVLTHESGKKYSWRIAILPYLDRHDIYDRYDFTQDWDSPHNLEVTSEMPDVFRSDSDDPDSTNTSFFMLTGPGGAFNQDGPTKIRDFTDGTSNTMTLIEAQRDVHWAKPEDIVIDPDSPLPDFGGFHNGGFNVGMGDGSVQFVDERIAEDILREYFTRGGGEISRPLVVEQASDEALPDDQSDK